jgi:hypothetical protein
VRPAVVAEQDRGLGVDAGEGRVGQREHARRLAQHHRRERHGVDPEVEQRAAAQLGREQAVRAILGEPLGVVRVDRHDLAQRAIREQPLDLAHVRQKARPHRLHQEQPTLARLRDQLLASARSS